MVGSALMITSLHTEKNLILWEEGHCRKSQFHKLQLSQSRPPWHRHWGYITNSPRERTHLLQDIYPNTIPKVKVSSPLSIEKVDWFMWEGVGERNQNTIMLYFWIYNFYYTFNFRQIKLYTKPKKRKPEAILISHFLWLLKHT